MANYATFAFLTTGLSTLKGNFVSASGQIVKQSDGSLLANNAANRALASIVGSDSGHAGSYYFTMPAAASAGIYTLIIWFNPTWADGEAFLAETAALVWDGSALTDSSSTVISSTNSMTVATARDILRRVARNSKSSADYTDADVDYALMSIGGDFCLHAKPLRQIDILSLSASQWAIDASGITNFEARRLLRAEMADTSNNPLTTQPDSLDLIDWDEVWRRQGRQTVLSGIARAIGWKSQTDGGLDRATDQAYHLILHWSPPFGIWTAGDAGASSNVLSLDYDLMQQIIELGGPVKLQWHEPAHMKACDIQWQRYVDFRNRQRDVFRLAGYSSSKGRTL